jgi:hypothetical protein
MVKCVLKWVKAGSSDPEPASKRPDRLAIIGPLVSQHCSAFLATPVRQDPQR